MPKLYRTSHARFIFIVVMLIMTTGIDQGSKMLVRNFLPATAGHSYLGDIVRIQHAENPGAFLSFGSGFSETTRFDIFVILTGLFLVGALWTMLQKPDLERSTLIGLALMVGGGIGNLIDRIIFSSVTDFLNFGIGPVRTGIFNIADMAIVAGVGVMMFTSFFATKKPTTK